MTYRQACQLTKELETEDYAAYHELLDTTQPDAGYVVKASRSEGRKITEEVWHINADRSYPRYI